MTSEMVERVSAYGFRERMAQVTRYDDTQDSHTEMMTEQELMTIARTMRTISQATEIMYPCGCIEYYYMDILQHHTWCKACADEDRAYMKALMAGMKINYRDSKG